MAVSLLLGSPRPPSTQLFSPIENWPENGPITTDYAENFTARVNRHARLSAHGPQRPRRRYFRNFSGRKIFEKNCVQEALLIFLESKKERLPCVLENPGQNVIRRVGLRGVAP